MAHVGHQVDEEGNEHFEEHVEVRVLHTDGAGALDDPVAEQAQENAEQKAADELNKEIDAGIDQREGDPVTTAAMANWKDTMPEASFKSSSPFNMEA